MKDTFKVILGAGESGVGAALLAKAKGFKYFESLCIVGKSKGIQSICF
jgi:hypothetical protein